MEKKFLVLYILIAVSLILNAYFVSGFFLVKLELKNTQEKARITETNEKVLFFAKIFVDKILLGSGTVDFDDRLELENSVRDINNPEIFGQWQKFVASQGDKEAQTNAGLLFKLLLSKISQ